MTFPGDLPTSMAQDLVSGWGKEPRADQSEPDTFQEDQEVRQITGPIYN